MSDSYAPSSYDHFYCLKPPLMMWLAVLYLSRALTLPIAMAVGSFSGVNDAAIHAFRSLWSADKLAPSALAAVVLIAAFRRAPQAAGLVRWIWAHGRILLAAAAALDLGLSLIAPLRAGEIDERTIVGVIAAAIDAYFLVYILASRRMRDTFAEFPPPLEATKE